MPPHHEHERQECATAERAPKRRHIISQAEQRELFAPQTAATTAATALAPSAAPRVSGSAFASPAAGLSLSLADRVAAVAAAEPVQVSFTSPPHFSAVSAVGSSETAKQILRSINHFSSPLVEGKKPRAVPFATPQPLFSGISRYKSVALKSAAAKQVATATTPLGRGAPYPHAPSPAPSPSLAAGGAGGGLGLPPTRPLPRANVPTQRVRSDDVVNPRVDLSGLSAKRERERQRSPFPAFSGTPSGTPAFPKGPLRSAAHAPGASAAGKRTGARQAYASGYGYAYEAEEEGDAEAEAESEAWADDEAASAAIRRAVEVAASQFKFELNVPANTDDRYSPRPAISQRVDNHTRYTTSSAAFGHAH